MDRIALNALMGLDQRVDKLWLYHLKADFALDQISKPGVLVEVVLSAREQLIPHIPYD